MVLAFLIGIPVGIIQGMKAGSKLDTGLLLAEEGWMSGKVAGQVHPLPRAEAALQLISQCAERFDLGPIIRPRVVYSPA